MILTERSREIASTAQQDVARFDMMLREGIPAEDMEAFFRVTEMIRYNIEKNFKKTEEKLDD